jgi:hypothetical protein
MDTIGNKLIRVRFPEFVRHKVVSYDSAREIAESFFKVLGIEPIRNGRVDIRRLSLAIRRLHMLWLEAMTVQ